MTEQMTQTEDLVNFVLQHAKPDLTGNTTAVLVALPRAMDSIRLVGDEDKHATIMFFGETESLPADAKGVLTETIQNLSRLFTPFTEHVQSISRLGSDNPPALVALLSNGTLGKMREAALINPKLGDYLSNATQYPSYTPHVTLGYPDYQEEAKIRQLAEGLYRVRFDRLALWWGDEHIEFSLETMMNDVNQVASPMMHDDSASAFIVQQALGIETKALSHAKEPTFQDVYDSMSAEQQAISSLIIGAAVEDLELPEDEEVTRVYNSLTAQQKNLIDFVVGAALAEDSTIDHSAIADEEYLAHFGVKGMKWGVRNDSSGSGLSKSGLNTREARKAARAQVKAGTASLGTAHVAALKSTGHRVANAVLGDKTYWKRALIISGVAVAGIGASFAVPAIMPASLLASIGGHVGGTSGVAGYAVSGGKLVSLASVGQQAVTGAISAATLAGTNVAGFANVVANTGRAIRGNARINKSYEVLGKNLRQQQTRGNEQVQKILSRNGGINKKLLRHDDMTSIEDLVEDFLAHFGVRGMKWGVRRTDAQLGKLNRKQAKLASAQAKVDAKQAKLDAKGAKSGIVRVGAKTDDGDEVDVHVSVDAERFIKTQMKSGVQMSDRELKEAIQRANLVRQYNDVFKKDPNADLRAKADAIELNRKIADLTRRPSKTQQLNKFFETSSKGFEAYNKLNKATGGSLNKKMKLEFGQDTASKVARQVRARETSLFNDIQRTGSVAKALSSKTPSVSSSTAKQLRKSRALREEVEQLLRYAGDGSVQTKLF